jgi:hypothetical protein
MVEEKQSKSITYTYAFSDGKISSIAWFKLEELVTRRERERVRGLLRLLLHSIPSQALAQQLEGDIALVCSDYSQAQRLHLKAAAKYEQLHQWVNAAALYARIHSYNSPTLLTTIQLARCYAWVGHSALLTYYLEQACTIAAQQGDYEPLLLLAEEQFSFARHEQILSLLTTLQAPIQLIVAYKEKYTQHAAQSWQAQPALKARDGEMREPVATAMQTSTLHIQQ